MGCSFEKDLDEFLFACHRVGGYGLVRCSSGNLSWRLGSELMAVTAKGSWLGELEKEQIAICRLSDGGCVNGRTASVEEGMHRAVLTHRADVEVVLHFQTPCATAMACEESVPEAESFFVIPEVPYYVGKVGLVEYLTPGTEELAAAVGEAMRGHDLVLLRNHGQVAVGKTFDEVIQRAAFFELACEILLVGRSARRLSEGALAALSKVSYG